MRIEFPQGVSDEIIKWLWDNVGNGNVIYSVRAPSDRRRDPKKEDDWLYERVGIPNKDPKVEWSYVPTITVKDERMAMWFVLKWGS